MMQMDQTEYIDELEAKLDEMRANEEQLLTQEQALIDEFNEHQSWVDSAYTILREYRDTLSRHSHQINELMRQYERSMNHIPF